MFVEGGRLYHSTMASPSLCATAMGVDPGGRGHRSPKIWSGGAQYRCPPNILLVLYIYAF